MNECTAHITVVFSSKGNTFHFSTLDLTTFGYIVQDATSNGDLYEDGEMFASQRMLASLRERYVRRRALQIRAEQIAFRLDVYHTLWFVLGNVFKHFC